MVDLLLQPPPQFANQPCIHDRRSVAQRRSVEERRLALVVEYQGTNYHGFQLQDDQPTIQGELEQALHRLTGQPVRVRGASRTDSGAHAKAQVVDFLTPALLSKDVFMRGLNFYLPPDIKVRASYDIDLDFHSRNSASSRTYRYTFLNNPAPSPLMREFSHWVRDTLDLPTMNEAATALHGVHDFAPLAGALPPGRYVVRGRCCWRLDWGDWPPVYCRISWHVTPRSQLGAPHSRQRASALYQWTTTTSPRRAKGHEENKNFLGPPRRPASPMARLGRLQPDVGTDGSPHRPHAAR